MNKRKMWLASLGAVSLAVAMPARAAGPGVMSAPAAVTPQAQAALLAQLDARRAARGQDARHGYAILRQHPGTAGTQVARVAHTFEGVPIFGVDAVLVLDANGKIVSESDAARRANVVGLDVGPGTDFSVVPAISAKAAIDAALAVLAAPPSASRHEAPPSAELVIWPAMRTERVPAARDKAEDDLNALDVQDVVDRYELAYLVRTRMVVGAKPAYHDTIVSARDGTILARWTMLQTVVGVGHSQYNGDVPIGTTFADGKYRMVDATRGTGGTFGAMAITNADHGTSAGSVYVNDTNTWGDGKQYVAGGSTMNANGQTAAVNAMWGLMNTYDTLKNVFNWLSLDGHDTATYIAAHVNTAYDNAYYSDTCRCMFIGDGSSFYSLGSIDVIGHEMGHGVTAATSNLTYAGESGGLNESSSDINGEAVEAYARAGGHGDHVPPTGNDWVLGKEISRTGTPLRWMYRPSKDGNSPDAWSSALKRLDVHYSSGPNNRMFYFLAQGSSADKTSDHYSKYLVRTPAAMTGIGIDKAYRIWFKANTTKFTSSTNYADARAKMIEAAAELYGPGSREAVAVQHAYAAVNVGADEDEPAQ
ncbi:M4 family metallopeptidase [Massilia pinisoli]|uniref:Neutral metalloproteinase n=1 Tax=Massilia pinisoli TaxID=1772194 RepID=A0ABT1ZSF4_9BURK|nr:M4 family metallopeptidase [Massilia pinisoli]MCS0582811.1 M4 family metallopeptidase [Massilia pinisoli]